MEAFALLRYWSTTAGATGDSISIARRRITRCATKPAAAAAPYSGYGFDGPYFDLDFALVGGTSESDSETEKLSENGDDLRFSYGSDESENQIAKSGTEFRVLLLNLKKSKSDSNWIPEKSKLGKIEAKGVNQGRVRGKMLTVKFDLKERKRPLVSLFARDESNYPEGFKHDLETNSVSNERNLGEQLSHKYLNKLKPLHIRVSSRFVEKMKLSGDFTPRTAAKGRSGVKRSNNLQAWVNEMREHLVKSRSNTPAPPSGKTGSSRREEVVAEDGIEGAILHCKSSFNSSIDNYSTII